jgi:hypothetical protein
VPTGAGCGFNAGDSLGGEVASPRLTAIGVASPARFGLADGREREDDAGRFLACPAACCADRPGSVFAGGGGVSGTGGAPLLTGALGFTEGDSLGGGGAVGSPWIAGAEAASAARFGPEG